MPTGRKPVLCYVTDRRALEIPSVDSLVAAIQASIAAGVDWIQIREKDLDAHSLVDLVRSAMQAAQGSATKIIVNERLDVAVACGAAGVHLGENSLPAEAVARWRREAGSTGFQIGASCHSLNAARAAEQGGAGYLFFGPVFATPSKEKFGPPQGLDRLREACAAVEIPALAIGGITLENATSCLAAGASGIAAIRLFQQSPDAVSRLRAL